MNVDEINHDENLKWYEKIINNKEYELSRNCKYYYNRTIINEQINKLKELSSVTDIYYAVKANFNKEIIKYLIEKNIGLETVSLEEIELILSIVDNYELEVFVNIIYTPNFADLNDYERIFKIKRKDVSIIVILDNLDIIKDYEIFNGKRIGIRLDLNLGAGHCKKVITQGSLSKFGVLPSELISYKKLLDEKSISIIGFHSHMGSGIYDYELWSKNFEELLKLTNNLSLKIEFLNIGGGFGVDKDIDFKKLNECLKSAVIEYKYTNKIIIEPGRFLVADCGVIIGKVNQIKIKNSFKIIGINISMTDIIRFCLYDAKHEIIFYGKDNNNKYKQLKSNNFSNNINSSFSKIVGTICESGDIFYESLDVNENIKINDIAIMLKTGAYGRVMSSNYNCKNFPDEIIIDI